MTRSLFKYLAFYVTEKGIRSGALFANVIGCLAGALLAWPAYSSVFDTSINVGVGWAELKERSQDGHVLVKETGFRNQIGAMLSTDLFGGRIESLAFASKSLQDYSGQSQSGTPLSTDTKWTESRIAISYAYTPIETFELKAGVERGSTHRRIVGTTDVAGLDEVTLSIRSLLGIGHSFTAFNCPATFSSDVIIGISGNTTVSSTGRIDAVSLPEGKYWGFRLRGTLAIKGNDSANWQLTPSLEYSHSDRSREVAWSRNGVIRGKLAQPEIESWRVNVEFGRMW